VIVNKVYLEQVRTGKSSMLLVGRDDFLIKLSDENVLQMW